MPDQSKLAATVLRMKHEILAHVAGGIVPATCPDYAGLHDYVDANGYGGAFEPGGLVICSDDDSNIADAHASTDYWNAAQGQVDEWIRNGGLSDTLGSSKAGRPKKTGERCPCGLMLATTAAKRYHKCEPKGFTERLRDLEQRTRPADYELQHEGE